MSSYAVMEFTEALVRNISPPSDPPRYVAEQLGPIWICPIAITVIRPARETPGIVRIATDSGEAFLVFADPVDVVEQVSMYHQERDAL